VHHHHIKQDPVEEGYAMVREIWKAADDLWKARNKMERSATPRERTLHAVARMNKRLAKAYARNN